MDNMRSGSDPCKSTEYASGAKTPRTRQKRSKLSSVNSRLDPNFDPKERLFSKAYETNTQHVELNPKTMEFEKLVGLLHPAFILEYLQKILRYLTSNMARLCFQNIALDKEAFLVRLCQEKSNLNCTKFDEQSKKVARQIMDVLNENQNVYDWMYKYVKGIMSPDVLVFEKVYYTSNNLENINNIGLKVTGTPRRSIQLSSANGDHNKQAAPINKVHLLNTLLRFIKDNTQLTLEYPHVPISQASLLASLICQHEVSDMEVGFGCKSLYAPLWLAVDAHKEMYDFNITYQENSDVTLLMVLQKIPKKSKNKLHVSQQNSSLSNGDDTSGSSQNSLNKSSKSLTKFSGGLDETFLRSSLKKVLGFMEEESSASLYFKNITVDECGFLSRIMRFSRESALQQHFSPKCRALFKKIDASNKNPNWKFTMEVSKKDKTTGLQNLSMSKNPRYKEKSTTVAQATHAPQLQTPRNGAGAATRGTPSKSISFQCAGAAIDKATEKDGTGAAIDNAQSATMKIIDNVEKLVANKSRKSKLLAAMSVPVKSDKGERMMRLMGWHGGALGARGEGLVEPIIPALHLAPGAGLGHVKQVNSSQSIRQFQGVFLQTILSFLRAGDSETAIQYDTPLVGQKARFVNRAKQGLKELQLPHDDDHKLVDVVIEEMVKQAVDIKFDVSSDKCKIALRKVASAQKSKLVPPTVKAEKLKANTEAALRNKKIYSPRVKSEKAKTNQPSPQRYQNTPFIQSTNSSNGCITETICESHVIDLKNFFELDRKTTTPKAARTLAYKVMCLTIIKHFIQVEEDTRKYVFCRVLKNKLKSYVSSVLMNVNRKTKIKLGSNIENIIYNDILKAAPPGCCLSILYEAQKFTLQKKIYQKRFTNSALDLPPPKSTDVKNTRLYQKNKSISCIGITNDENVDDVVIRTNKYDAVVITNDEDNEMTVETVTVNTDTQKDNSENNEDKVITNEESLDYSLIFEDCSKTRQDLNLSREALLLQTLEQDFQVKTEIVDSEKDNDIRELEQAILECDFLFREEKKPVHIFGVKLENETPENNCTNLNLEINNNNNSLIAENKSNYIVSDCMQQREKRSVDVTVDCTNKKHVKDKNSVTLHTLQETLVSLELTSYNTTETDNEGIKVSKKYILEENVINKSSKIIEDDHYNTEQSEKTFIKIIQLKKEMSNENIDKTDINEEKSTKSRPDSLNINEENANVKTEIGFKEDYRDISAGKRSRSASMSSELELSCKKCKSEI